MIRLVVILLLPLLMTPRLASGHEVWITADIGQDDQLDIRIGCGHSFPASSLAIADRVVASLTLLSLGDDAPATVLSTHTEGSWRVARHPVPASPALLTLTLQRPRQPEPVGWSRTWWFSHPPPSEPLPSLGEGLEIVVITPPSSWHIGKPIELELHDNRQSLSARGTLHNPDGSTRPIRLNAAQPATIVPSQAGAMMISFTHRNQSATLVLTIRPAPTQPHES
ncbi:MAG TPA: hypothetical protein PKE55_10545 [Kiritimatiellia bacterium]|nr:hypothetical protein [Kiritimatiellia bacterium]